MDDSPRAATYWIRARNTAADSTNKIHDDEVARSYGFAGGLVAQVRHSAIYVLRAPGGTSR